VLGVYRGAQQPDHPGSYCGGGNYSFDPRYGWDDTNCESNNVFICELLRKCWPGAV
jgi:hypothetical protein